MVLLTHAYAKPLIMLSYDSYPMPEYQKSPQERHRRSGRGAAQPEEQPEEQPEASRTKSKEEVAYGDCRRCESAGKSGPAKAARQVLSVLYAYFFR